MKLYRLVDNLPCATKYEIPDKPGEFFYDNGYRIGWVDKDKVYVFNHVELVLRYHEPSPGVHRVVGFEVKPKSIAYDKYTVPSDSKVTYFIGVSIIIIF